MTHGEFLITEFVLASHLTGQHNWRARMRTEPCSYCGRLPKRGRGTTDHIVPRVEGGPNGWENETAACAGCNREKGALNAIQYLVKRGGFISRDPGTKRLTRWLPSTVTN